MPSRPTPHLAVLIAGLAIALTSALPARGASPDDIYWKNPFPESGAPDAYTDVVMPHGDGYLFGGYFRQVSDVNVLRIASWDAQGWHAMGTGVGTYVMGLVHVIRLDGDGAYVGGMFDQIGTYPAPNIARYDFARRWYEPLGGGTDRAVRGIAVAPNGDVYAVGEFTMAGGVPAHGIARWDGTSWHDVGGSLGARARALAIATDGDDVYVGGYFDQAGDQPIGYIARWDGQTWHALGAGVDNIVTAITIRNGMLYAGGAFTMAGGKPANRFARWDGTKWQRYGSGLYGLGLSHIRGIEVDIDQVYVTGTFTETGDGRTVNYISTWDGTGWQALGSGVNDQTKAVVLHDGVLWVTGNFTQAGGKDIPFVAQWTKPGKNTIVFDRLSAHAAGNDVELDWAFTSYGPWTDARIERRESGGEFEAITSVTGDASGRFLDTTVQAGRRYDYTLVVRRENGTESRSAPTPVTVGPAAISLDQNRPNPFNPTTTISFGLPAAARATLRVYDTAGRTVRTLIDGPQTAGFHEVPWDGRDDRGTGVATGVYFYRLSVDGQESQTKKMILVK